MNQSTQAASLSAENQLHAAAAGRQSSTFWGIAAGLMMICIGVLTFIDPVFTGISLAYLVTAGLSIYGITQIAAFIKTPSGQRSTSTLVIGFLLAGSSLFTLWASFQTPSGFAGMLSGLSIGVAFLAALQGIGQFLTFSEMQDAKIKGAGWVLAGGIVNTLLGIMILTTPIMSWFAISTVWSLYLGVSGIALLTESLSGHRGRKGDV